MKKIIFKLSLIILAITLGLYIYLNIKINIYINTNEQVLTKLNNLILENNQVLAPSDEYNSTLPKIEIDNTDYVGILSLPTYKVLLPIQSKCNNSFLSIESSCTYSSNPLIILGTNLKNSFTSYKLYNLNDEVTFTNTLGQTFQYKISKITRIDTLQSLSKYNDDLIIIIKNYYDVKYIIICCDSY